MKTPYGLATTLCILIAAAGASFAAALAVNHVAAQTITTAPISFPAVTLDGTDQLVNGSTAAWRVDASGQADGWNVTVASTDFADGAGHTIPVNALEVRLQDAYIVWASGDPNLPASTQADFIPLSGAGVKIASAAVGQATGVYDLSPDFRLTVPAETYAGSYSATVTVAVNTGP